MNVRKEKKRKEKREKEIEKKPPENTQVFYQKDTRDSQVCQGPRLA